jgi:hypothetical protein
LTGALLLAAGSGANAHAADAELPALDFGFIDLRDVAALEVDAMTQRMRRASD